MVYLSTLFTITTSVPLDRGITKRKTLITAGFVIAAVLQGISYPAIALAADSTTADQQEPASSLVTEQSNSTTEGTDTKNETSRPDQTEAFSNDITGNETTPKAYNGESTDQAAVNTAPQPESATNDGSDDPSATTPQDGWNQDKSHWYENGQIVRSKFFYNKSSDA